MKTSKRKIAFIQAMAAIMFIHCVIGVASEPVPSNYNEVKALLNRYAEEIDYPTEDGVAARVSLSLKVDEALPALRLLFSENNNDQYRTAIITLFYHSNEHKKDVITFLVGQLSNPPDQWQGQTWIKSAMDILTKLDTESARVVARNGLSSRNLYIQAAAIQALGKSGNADDIGRLESFATRRLSVNPKHQEDELTIEAKSAASLVYKRSTH